MTSGLTGGVEQAVSTHGDPAVDDLRDAQRRRWLGVDRGVREEQTGVVTQVCGIYTWDALAGRHCRCDLAAKSEDVSGLL